MTSPTAAAFDDWYAAIAASPAWEQFIHRALDLPPGIDSTGYLSGPGLAEVQGLLDLRAGQTLVELGCGRAGYGLAAIARTGALLTGVDFSATALGAAETTADRLGLGDRATFRQADITRTGLPDGSADVVLCVDAFHFADPGDAARECRRLLKPGGRIVITTWMPISPEAAPRLPARIARMDIERDLERAGFVDIEASPRPDWLRREAALWAEAATLQVGSDEALASLRHEALEFLPLVDDLQRLRVLARAPGRPGLSRG